mmetsp:Transcript_15783/g.19574  ORF Transcript_15783/g.19574 Transcript_15783/m.19574 type:complete len:147 (-) Transcript_15783:201-641(-)|eukprot:CAMPEP_0204844982 /NCGR_PEP_ID=MMETSP1347-20130617/761_1 /ASSEMBLY_ACC=CAM_ASM_000690 /TAXON_ID=215587 /ORGANISM="Aplanochytrium stocchinoi, Strain GSBS06" /LENGTH=146 /DNA_ID=CAMNT_0051984775 /DNA_START=346 /DNA_END=786 /DNA_ORIENTATION=-
MFALTTSDIPSIFDDMEKSLAMPRQRWSKDPTTDPKCLAMDMIENDKEYTAIFDVPGVNKKDVHISVEGQRLSVSVDHKDEHKGEKGKDDTKVHWRERHVGHISRTMQLPNNVDMNSIQANQDNGVLKIHFTKKAADSNVRKITVN